MCCRVILRTHDGVISTRTEPSSATVPNLTYPNALGTSCLAKNAAHGVPSNEDGALGPRDAAWQVFTVCSHKPSAAVFVFCE